MTLKHACDIFVNGSRRLRGAIRVPNIPVLEGCILRGGRAEINPWSMVFSSDPRAG